MHECEPETTANIQYKLWWKFVYLKYKLPNTMVSQPALTPHTFS